MEILFVFSSSIFVVLENAEDVEKQWEEIKKTDETKSIFDDIDQKLLITKRIQYIEPVITVSTAKKLAKYLESLGPIFTKFGQLLSTRPDDALPVRTLFSSLFNDSTLLSILLVVSVSTSSTDGICHR